MPKLLCGLLLSLAMAGQATAAELIYDTTHSSIFGAEITPTADGIAASLGDRIVLAGTARRLTELRVEVFALHSAEPFDLMLRLYTDSATSGAAGSACGSGSGTLIPGSTLIRQVTPPALGTPFPVSFDLPRLDLAGEIDDTLVVSLNASRCDIYWAINEVPLVGSQPAGEPMASVVERCGSSVANNGPLDFGVANNFGLRISADSDGGCTECCAPGDCPEEEPELTGTMTVPRDAGEFRVNERVIYTVILRNPTEVEQPNTSAHEFTDDLPWQLDFVDASASTGERPFFADGTVTWDGMVRAMESVTLTIEATIKPGTEGQTVSNQGRIRSGTEESEKRGVTDDPFASGPTDATEFTVQEPPVLPVLSGTKTVAGNPANFPVGGLVTYTVILRNETAVVQPDTSAPEFIDVLPSELTMVSVSPMGIGAVANGNTVTFNGMVLANEEVTLTIQAIIVPGTELRTVSNQGKIQSGTEGNVTDGRTDDPTKPGPADPTEFVVAPPPCLAKLSAKKSVSSIGSFLPGGLVTYAVEITNSGCLPQADNPGDEFVDVLPGELLLQDAETSGGTVIANETTGEVRWNGALAPEASVFVSFEALIDDDVVCGTTITNQGTLHFDSEGDGVNESFALTDDPALPGEEDPTSFKLFCKGLSEVPALSPAGLLAMALLLAAAAGWRLRR